MAATTILPVQSPQEAPSVTGESLTPATSSAPSTVDGLAAATLTTAWLLITSSQAVPFIVASGCCLALAMALLTWSKTRQTFINKSGNAILLIVVSFMTLISADRLTAAWEERAPQFGLTATLTAPVLSLIGYPAASERGLLFVEHPEGLVTIVPSMEKLGVDFFVQFVCIWLALRLCRDRRRLLECLSLVGLTTVAAVLCRFLVLSVVYLEHDDILVGNAGQAALDWLANPYVSIPFIFVAGIACDRLCRAATRDAPVVALNMMSRLASAKSCIALAAAGCAATLAWFYVPPAPVKHGRILIDDRFCEVWEPTARQLDTEWYGDFSTYSFTSLAEWLGHWYPVDVNTSKIYEDSLLSDYDILIIKTPVEAFPDAERSAIDRFVHRGGGLLLVGDHTNLLGMGTHLNSLCARYGIRFRYDSVSDKGGGFVRYKAPAIGRHLAALHVDEMEFMTGCSLEINGTAEAILATDDCRREPHDYAAPSFFGRRGPHPELEHGRVISAATVRVGQGRITAFTDSTVWSSFAVFQSDRHKLAMDMIRQLNRPQSLVETPLRIAAAIGAIGVALMFAQAIRVGSAPFALIAMLLGGWAGVAASDELHRRAYAWPAPRAPISEVAFLWQGGACAFPPVLGTPSNFPMERAFDTLLVSTQRLGFVPRIAWTFDRDLLSDETRAMFVVAPVNRPPRQTLRRLHDFVEGGGNLIIIDDGSIAERGSARDYLAAFDIGIQYHAESRSDGKSHSHVHLSGNITALKAPADDLFVASGAHGKGHVAYVFEAVEFSRKGMGHCFARPWKSARARYDTIFWLLRDLLRIAPLERRYYGIL